MLNKFLLIAVLCTLSCTTPAHAVNQPEDAVAATVERMRVLLVTPDKAKLSAIVADELSYGHSGGKVDTKDSFIDALVTGESHFLSAEFRDQSIRVVGNTAIVRHQLVGEVADKGKAPASIAIKVLQVWTEKNGQWLLLARQAIKVPVPATAPTAAPGAK